MILHTEFQLPIFCTCNIYIHPDIEHNDLLTKPFKCDNIFRYSEIYTPYFKYKKFCYMIKKKSLRCNIVHKFCVYKCLLNIFTEYIFLQCSKADPSLHVLKRVQQITKSLKCDSIKNFFYALNKNTCFLKKSPCPNN